MARLPEQTHGRRNRLIRILERYSSDMLCVHPDQNSPCQRRSAYPMPTRVNRGQRKSQHHCVSANRRRCIIANHNRNFSERVTNQGTAARGDKCVAHSKRHGLQEWFRLDSSMLLPGTPYRVFPLSLCMSMKLPDGIQTAHFNHARHLGLSS